MTLRYLVPTAVALMVVASTAEAGVQEKKALRAAQEMMEKSAEHAKEACGNTKLELELDVAQYDKYAYAGRETKVKYLGFIKGHTENFFYGMAEACKDPDYKAEITKVTKVRFVGHPKEDQLKHEITLEGTTVLVQMAPQYATTTYENQERLKKLF